MRECPEVSGKRYKLFKFPYTLMLFVSRFMIFLSKFGVKPLITPGFVKKYVYQWNNTSDKAVKELGYKITPLKTAFKQTIEWHRSNAN